MSVGRFVFCAKGDGSCGSCGRGRAQPQERALQPFGENGQGGSCRGDKWRLDLAGTGREGGGCIGVWAELLRKQGSGSPILGPSHPPAHLLAHLADTLSSSSGWVQRPHG